MTPTIGQIAAASYEAVVNKNRTPQNQWVANAAMREFERQGFIDRESFGKVIEMTLDYQRNPDAGFLATDFQPVGMSKTEVLTAAQYSIAELSAPVKWSKKDEVQNPTVNQKVKLTSSLVTNGLNTHDDKIEQAIFSTSTNGFLGLQNLIADAGTGSIGGIDSGTETWWRNYSGTYVDDTDIEIALETAWNTVTKGSGESIQPTLLMSDAATQSLFASTQNVKQRFVAENEVKAGFVIFVFKTARYIFSQFGNTRIYLMSPKALSLQVSKEYFRDKGDTQEIPNINGFIFKIYSALQLCTGNRSRLGVVHL